MSYENALSKVSPEFQSNLTEIDTFLKSLGQLKFKRTVDKNSKKVTYTSPDYGISYAIMVSEANHHFGWYYLYNKEDKIWFRKTDYFEEVLGEIEKSNPQSAERIFNAINECTSCKGTPCSATAYTYNGKKQLACYGRMILPMSHESFDDARLFFQQLNSLVELKI